MFISSTFIDILCAILSSVLWRTVAGIWAYTIDAATAILTKMASEMTPTVVVIDLAKATTKTWKMHWKHIRVHEEISPPKTKVDRRIFKAYIKSMMAYCKLVTNVSSLCSLTLKILYPCVLFDILYLHATCSSFFVLTLKIPWERFKKK